MKAVRHIDSHAMRELMSIYPQAAYYLRKVESLEDFILYCSVGAQGHENKERCYPVPESIAPLLAARVKMVSRHHNLFIYVWFCFFSTNRL